MSKFIPKMLKGFQNDLYEVTVSWWNPYKPLSADNLFIAWAALEQPCPFELQIVPKTCDPDHPELYGVSFAPGYFIYPDDISRCINFLNAAGDILTDVQIYLHQLLDNLDDKTVPK